MRYLAFDPQGEVRGAVMLRLIDCVRREEIAPFLQKHGLFAIEPEAWYPLQAWLDLLGDIRSASSENALFDFVCIGMKISERVKLPAGFEQLPYEELVLSHDKIYQAQHRGGNVGSYSVEQAGDKHITLAVKTPYPDDLVYGVMCGEAQRFLPPGTRPAITFDERVPRRDQGGEVTVIHVRW
jgi:hypothetical protein